MEKFEISGTKIYINRIEFMFHNLSPNTIEIYVEWCATKNLQHITTLPKNSSVYVYPPKDFKPGVTLFAKLPGDPMGTFVYKPYTLYYMDYHIYFGEVSTDIMHARITNSTRNEILALTIENRSLKSYDVWFERDYLGRVGPYHPMKKKIEYTIYTTNNDKHFQLGGKLIFQMANSEKQSFILTDKDTTDIYLGDVVGRTEFNK